MLPEGLDYGTHGLIYANARVMWRTARKIAALKGQPLIFPQAYRDWVEAIYHEEPWGDEPLEVEERYQKFLDEHQCAQKYAAQMMLNSTQNMTPFMDDDQTITAVTRDGQMSLTLVPFLETSKGRILISSVCWEETNRQDRFELLAMNKISVPHSWRYILDQYCQQDDGIYWLKMSTDGDKWETQIGSWTLRYNKITGMERIK